METELRRLVREMRGAAYRAGGSGETYHGPAHQEYHKRLCSLIDHLDERGL